MTIKSLLEVVRFRYGNHVFNLLANSSNWIIVRKINVDIEFLKSCLEDDICGTFLRYKMSSERLQNSEFCRISQGLILKEEISFKTVEGKRLLARCS